MEQINKIELNDPNIYPDDEILKMTLKNGYSVYKRLLQLFDANEIVYDWKYYRDGKAWLCKVEKKKRTIVWMSAWNGYMKATIYFPPKYIDGIYSLEISEMKKQEIQNTKNVGKSKPCMFDLKSMIDINDMEKVFLYKIISK